MPKGISFFRGQRGAGPSHKELRHRHPPPKGRLELDLHELWEYRDLIGLLVRRSLVVKYKQSILGPAWAFIQPIISALILAFTFEGMGFTVSDPSRNVPLVWNTRRWGRISF